MSSRPVWSIERVQVTFEDPASNKSKRGLGCGSVAKCLLCTRAVKGSIPSVWIKADPKLQEAFLAWLYSSAMSRSRGKRRRSVHRCAVTHICAKWTIQYEATDKVSRQECQIVLGSPCHLPSWNRSFVVLDLLCSDSHHAYAYVIERWLNYAAIN